MRCKISNPKKLRKLSELSGLNVTAALTRGNSDHTIDLLIDNQDGWPWDGGYYLKKDGTLCQSYYDSNKEFRTRIIKSPLDNIKD